MHERAGTAALPADLIDVPALLEAYHSIIPDPATPEQRVVFGTSGHRGTARNGSFNEHHILAITQAIVEYRAAQGITGPLFLGSDTHPLSAPAEQTVRSVLLANGVRVYASLDDEYVPTPALSHGILHHNRAHPDDLADGIIITPSHNPPQDGGIKYNPPHGGPADSDATGWIAARANALLEAKLAGVRQAAVDPARLERYDYLGRYVQDIAAVVDVAAIRQAGVRIGAHPLGGASVSYWAEIARQLGLDVQVLGPGVDPQWAFMTLDWDGNIRMDPSSPHAMAGALASRADFDLVVGNDADADRHGIITPDGGLMNPNHFLAVCIDYLFTHRPGWGAHAAVGKTLVSSSIIDRVCEALGRELVEVPVGFKWFVPGLSDGSLGFGGEESAGASLLRMDGGPWSTDKDGIVLGLLAAEILAVTGKTPSALYRELTARFGEPHYQRVDARATPQQKAVLAALTPASISANSLAGDPIVAVHSAAPGNGAAIGGIKVVSDRAWFAARPSGTEDVYKIYAESFVSEAHLAQVLREAQSMVDAAVQAVS